MKISADLQIYLDNEIYLDKKQIALLKAIAKTGSIKEAAKILNISYKSAWDYLNALNFKQELVICKKNSGTKLSQEALKIIKNYELIQNLQQSFLDKISNININLEFISKFCFTLSARNQLQVTITKIIQGAVNCEVIGRLENGDELKATITLKSQQNMDLKLEDSVYFIFKAPSVIISKDKLENSLMPNILKAKVISATLGAVNSEIIASLSNQEQIVAIIPNDSTMDLRLSVNDEIGVIINANDIIIGK